MVLVKRCFLGLFFCLSGMLAAQETRTLAPESVLTITGTSTVHDWEVAAGAINGSLTGDIESIRDLIFEVPVAEIKGERGPTMDNKMHAALKVETHPKVVFELTRANKENIFTGNLIIAGVENEIGVETEPVNDDGKIRISGAYTILLKDYDIEPPTAMFGQIVVGDSVTVKFNLVFQKN